MGTSAAIHHSPENTYSPLFTNARTHEHTRAITLQHDFEEGLDRSGSLW
jgi:hypothetical protein